MTDQIIESMKFSAPESSKEFKASQDAMLAQAVRDQLSLDLVSEQRAARITVRNSSAVRV
jgi:hypothetical protein